jgi:Protein of unknown function (DUF2829)
MIIIQNCLNFGQAIQALKRGKTISRNKHKLVFMMEQRILPSIMLPVPIQPFTNVTVKFENQIFTYQNEIVETFIPTQDDMLSESWMIVNKE